MEQTTTKRLRIKGQIVEPTVTFERQTTYRKKLFYITLDGIMHLHSSVVKDIKLVCDSVGKTLFIDIQEGWYEITEDAFKYITDIMHNEGYYFESGTTKQYQQKSVKYDKIPEEIKKALMSWAKEFGHDINDEDGYVHYKSFIEKGYIFADPACGIVSGCYLKERGIKLYFNYFTIEGKHYLVASNHRKCVSIDIMKELTVYDWFLKNEKFNQNLLFKNA